jgi:single-strand DNA-binding protein
MSVATVARPAGTSTGAADTQPFNEVRLRGRVSGPPQARELPSGDVVVAIKLVVPRAPGSRSVRPGETRRRTVDTLDCAVWRADLRRKVGSWSAGDLVEVVGALHRRFWRFGGNVASRCEVEVTAVRRLERVARRPTSAG